MFRFMYAIQDINNGTLRAVKAMPQKDSTSDGTSNFELPRIQYQRTIPTNAETLQKKWMGNRDASSVVEQKKRVAVGLGTFNDFGQPLSFTTYKDVNTVSSALTRVRAGGAVAPPKKNALRTNDLTPTFSPAQNKVLYGIKSPTSFH
uniref:Uncharacterized protein n=1 Tax=viral metagenome TaxID=1070528 RepID=A0A6C0I4J5_9ZZZZ